MLGPGGSPSAAAGKDSYLWGTNWLFRLVNSEGAGQKEMPALPGNPTLPLAECAGTQLAAPTCSYSKQNFTF